MNKHVIEFFANHTQDTAFEALGYVFVDFDKATEFVGGTSGTVTTYTREQAEQWVKENAKEAIELMAPDASDEDKEQLQQMIENKKEFDAGDDDDDDEKETTAEVVDETPAVLINGMPMATVETFETVNPTTGENGTIELVTAAPVVDETPAVDKLADAKADLKTEQEKKKDKKDGNGKR